MTAVFRLAQEADLPALAQNRWRLRTEEDAERPGVDQAAFLRHCEGFLRTALASAHWAMWVGEDEGRILANAFVQVVPKVPRPGRFDDAVGYLTNVYVEPEERGHGLGAELLRQVVAWARDRDLELLIVWPSERSRTLYARAGFRAESEIMEQVLRPE